MELKDCVVGQVVRIHPATDLFMRGVQWATIVYVGRFKVKVEAHIAGTQHFIHPQYISREDN